MSQRAVGDVIHKLLTDEELRIRFCVDRFVTLAELHLLGFSLTSEEIDAFVQSDIHCWIGDSATFADRH